MTWDKNTTSGLIKTFITFMIRVITKEYIERDECKSSLWRW